MLKDGVECYQLAMEKLQSIVSTKFIDVLLSENEQKIISNILSHRLEKRLWLIISKESLKDLWGDIRREEAFCDFLFETTIALRCEFVSQEWKNLAKQLSEAYTCCSDVYEGDYNVIDDEMFSRLPEKEEFYKLLMCNPWFLVLNVLNNTYLDILEKVSDEVQKE